MAFTPATLLVEIVFKTALIFVDYCVSKRAEQTFLFALKETFVGVTTNGYFIFDCGSKLYEMNHVR